jgi:hypothetical protein
LASNYVQMNTNSVLEVLRKNPLVTAGAAACAGVGMYFLRKVARWCHWNFQLRLIIYLQYIAGGVNTHRPDLTGKVGRAIKYNPGYK